MDRRYHDVPCVEDSLLQWNDEKKQRLAAFTEAVRSEELANLQAVPIIDPVSRYLAHKHHQRQLTAGYLDGSQQQYSEVGHQLHAQHAERLRAKDELARKLHEAEVPGALFF
jgi:hypothetical protein